MRLVDCGRYSRARRESSSTSDSLRAAKPRDFQALVHAHGGLPPKILTVMGQPRLGLAEAPTERMPLPPRNDLHHAFLNTCCTPLNTRVPQRRLATSSGRLTWLLFGFVKSEEERTAADSRALQVGGVRAVKNQIVVQQQVCSPPIQSR
jgi:hypothetical protein